MPETIELDHFELSFTFNCPKCDYKNEDISARDIANGNAECGMWVALVSHVICGATPPAPPS